MRRSKSPRSQKSATIFRALTDRRRTSKSDVDDDHLPIDAARDFRGGGGGVIVVVAVVVKSQAAAWPQATESQPLDSKPIFDLRSLLFAVRYGTYLFRPILACHQSVLLRAAMFVRWLCRKVSVFCCSTLDDRLGCRCCCCCCCSIDTNC